jgi:hypothetical protein
MMVNKVFLCNKVLLGLPASVRHAHLLFFLFLLGRRGPTHCSHGGGGRGVFLLLPTAVAKSPIVTNNNAMDEAFVLSKDTSVADVGVKATTTMTTKKKKMMIEKLGGWRRRAAGVFDRDGGGTRDDSGIKAEVSSHLAVMREASMILWSFHDVRFFELGMVFTDICC